MTRRRFGSIRRLGEGRYAVSVESERGGRRYRPTVVVRGTELDAEMQLARMAVDKGGYECPGITLEGYWNAFYAQSLSTLAPSTADGYKRAWERLVRPLFGGCRMDAMKAGDIERGLAKVDKPGQQRNAYKLMRQMFNMAYRDELIASNPFERRIRIKRMPKYEPDVLLLADVPAWLDAVRGSRYEPVLLCMLFGGMRREEACALYWSDVAFADGLCAIRVDKALTEVSGRLHDGPTKTAESTRTVFLGGYAARRLAELASEGPLVPDAKGNRMSPDKISREYKKMMESKDAKYVCMKNLRTSYATIMQGLGAADSLISRSLGHTNLKVDYDHYFAANEPAYMANARLLGAAVVERCRTPAGDEGKSGRKTPGQSGGPCRTRTCNQGIMSGMPEDVPPGQSVTTKGKNRRKAAFPTKMSNDVERFLE